MTFAAAVVFLSVLDTLLVVFLILPAIRRRRRRTALLRNADTRIRPHFVFNALHSIAALVSDDPDSAARMTARLTELVREGFSEPAMPVIRLCDEAAFVRNYAEIEEVRFSDRLVVHWNLRPDVLHAAVPRMCLQPLVENAIRHGLSAHESCVATIEAFRIRSQLCVAVSNEAGDGGAASRPPHESFGIGLSTVRDRLEAVHGTRAQLQLYRTEHSARAILTLPYAELD
ncbi:MAG TPA: histidine kinase [Thermoanaerobaculia bacterium]|nr:histidine kinase [Thermoanaerobaculia bacterium]